MLSLLSKGFLLHSLVLVLVTRGVFFGCVFYTPRASFSLRPISQLHSICFSHSSPHAAGLTECLPLLLLVSVMRSFSQLHSCAVFVVEFLLYSSVFGVEFLLHSSVFGVEFLLHSHAVFGVEFLLHSSCCFRCGVFLTLLMRFLVWSFSD